MSTVEERVARIKFDNADFEQKIMQTMRSLEALNKSLKLLDAAEGFSKVATASEKSRDSLGRFTKSASTGMQQVATSSDKTAVSVGKAGTNAAKGMDTISTASTKARNSMGQFTSEASKGLSDVAEASKKSSLDQVADSADNVGSRFKAMSIVGITALVNIANQAVDAGKRLISSFTFDPISSGFHEYETNMNSIQTIMANTGLEGKKGLAKVNAALDELNHYADQTIYNFSEMARNIGTFTAAGVDLKTSTAAIKGIANLAAVSGSNAEQASTAMYQLSQALAAGKLTLEDWNSVVNAGMGGKVFQDALIQTAKVHGKNIDKMIKKEGSFRLTLAEGWLTTDILTETLGKFTGDMTKKQLKAMGYTEKQIKGILKMGKTAQDAATKVKTMTQLIDTLQEGVGSGWTKTWQLLFGDFGEAKSMFTKVATELGKMVDASSDSRNKLLSDWKDLGGRTALIDGISNAFKALVSVVRPIKDAFRQIFPATTAKQLYDMTVTFRDFTAKLKIGSDTADKLRRTFAGVFAIFGIGWEIIKKVAKLLVDVFKTTTEGSGGVLKTAASFGDFLVAVHKAVQEGEGLTKFFGGLTKMIQAPIRLIKTIAKDIGSLFKDVDGKNLSDNFSGISVELHPFAKMGEMIVNVWTRVIEILGTVWEKTKQVGQSIRDFFKQFGSGVGNAIKDLDFTDVFAGIGTGAFLALVLSIKNLFNKEMGLGGFGELLEGANDAIEGFTKTLKSMQTTLRAATLLEIALAVGVLTLSMNSLAKINKEGLANASAAITIMFGQLIGSLLLFEKLSGFKGVAKMPFVAASMILMAGAVDLLTIAVKNLSNLSWKELSKGLTGVIVLLGSLTGATILMPNQAKLISTGIGLIALAGAIRLLVTSVKALSDMDWKELAKGITGVAVLLDSLLLFTKFAGVNGGIAQGVGIAILAGAIRVLVLSVKEFAKMSWKELGKGFASVAAGLVAIGTALYFIPPTAPASALGIAIVAGALIVVAKAVKSMAKMSWKEIAKGLVTLGVSLGVIAGALFLMTEALPGAAALFVVSLSLGSIAEALQNMGNMSWKEIAKSVVLLTTSLALIAAGMTLMLISLPGAAALLVVAGALTVLAPVLQKFGDMSWNEIAKSLTMLAGVLVVFGVASLALTPVVPIMIALAGAITLLGVGMLAAGAGVFLFATGLTAIAVSGGAATVVLVAMISSIAAMIPVVMKQIGLGMLALAEAIGNGGPAIVKSAVKVIGSLIDAITKLVPRIAESVVKIVTKILEVLAAYMPRIVDAGARILLSILNGLSKHMDKISDAASTVIVKFINGISRNLGKIIDAGTKMVINFVNGVAASIRQNAPAMGAAGGNLASAIIEGMARGLMSGVGKVVSAAKSVASSALSSAKGVLGIHSPSKEFEKIGKYVNDGFRKGLDGNKAQVYEAFNNLKTLLKETMKSGQQDVDTLEKKLKKLTSARHQDAKAIKETKVELAQARKEVKATSAAYTELTKKLNDEKTSLGKLADSYDKVTAKLDAAQEKYKNAIKTRDDYNKSIRDSYSDQATPAADMTVEEFTENLKKQIEDTKKFTNTLARLRAMGLNDELYKDLLAEGVDALPFAEKLLEAGPDAVKNLRKLSGDLNVAGEALGKQASKSLYQAAVDSAKGLVDGLKKQQANIEKQMDKIADAMVKAIKKKLGIKSPSRVFASIGAYSGEGLVKGFQSMMPQVQTASEDLGQAATDALSDAMRGVYHILGEEGYTKPTITPALDLSRVMTDAKKINDILSPRQMSSTYTKAMSAADGYLSLRTMSSVDDVMPESSITYIQNNNSPKSLSSAEIYRQTKNQLSQKKGALQTT